MTTHPTPPILDIFCLIVYNSWPVFFLIRISIQEFKVSGIFICHFITFYIILYSLNGPHDVHGIQVSLWSNSGFATIED